MEDGIPTASISGKGNRTSFAGRNSEFVYGDDDDEMESAVASAQDQREEELQVLLLLIYIIIYIYKYNSIIAIQCNHFFR